MIWLTQICFLLILPISMSAAQLPSNKTAAGEVVLASLGSPCVKVIDNQEPGATMFHYACPVGLTCSYNTYKCECESSSVPDSENKKCLPKATKPGDSCTGSAQCTPYLGERSECSTKEGKCECSEGTEWSDNYGNGKCFPVGRVLIGGFCNETSDCVGPPETSLCFAGTCSCDFVNETYGVAGFVVSRNMARCLPVRNSFGKECEESQQCHHGLLGHLSECKEEYGSLKKVCKCGDDAVAQPRYAKCFPKTRKLGEDCQVQMQCVAGLGPSECLNGKCVCLEGTFWNESRCSEK